MQEAAEDAVDPLTVVAGEAGFSGGEEGEEVVGWRGGCLQQRCVASEAQRSGGCGVVAVVGGVDEEGGVEGEEGDGGAALVPGRAQQLSEEAAVSEERYRGE